MLKIILISFISILTYFNFCNNTYLVISKNNLDNCDFNIVASVSEANSIDDIIGRPLYSNEINQYYFKNDKKYINLMHPNIGINFADDYNGNKLSISDSTKIKFPKILDLYWWSLIDITELIKNNFFFDINYDKYVTNSLFYLLDDHLNIEIDYYDKKVLYSLIKTKQTTFIKKLADINYGYFITLSKKFDIYKSNLNYYITKWNSNNNILIYLDKSIPKKWINIFKSGLQIWNKALKNCSIYAISYLDNNWIEFKNGDSRYSSISLSPSSVDNSYAVGHIDFNWRTGEIYRGNIMISGNWIDFWNNKFDSLVMLLELNRNEYEKKYCFRNNTLDSYNIEYHKNYFIKKGLKSVIVHEMGHILGLRHNFKASSLVNYYDLFNKTRINNEGLIPSIMDYISLIINTDKIYNCYTIDCIINNVYIMDDIGKYDYQTIDYGYNNKNNMDYNLGPDENLEYDALTNTHDISNLPAKYNSNYLNLSKYIIDNYNFKSSNFVINWKIKSDFIKRHYNYIKLSINMNLKILTSIDYNFKGDITNIIDSQKESLKFLLNILNNEFYILDKIYFTYSECEINENYICQGMKPYDLASIQNNIYIELSLILGSDTLVDKIERNNLLTNGKTISKNDFIQIINNYNTKNYLLL